MSWLQKLKNGLGKTSAKVTSQLSSLLGRSKIDATSLEEVEDALIAADLGTQSAMRLAASMRKYKFDGPVTSASLAAALYHPACESPERSLPAHPSAQPDSAIGPPCR